MSTALIDRRTVQVDAALVVAHALCAAYTAGGACLCKGSITRCHAPTIYATESVAVIAGLERAGFVLAKKEVGANVDA